MSSSSTPRQADFPMSKGPGAQVSRRTLTRSSSDGSDELHGAIAQLSLSPSSLAQHETVNSSSHQDDIDVESANSAPSPPQSPYLAGSDTSYDFDRPSEDGRSGGLSSLSPQPSLYSLTDSLRAQIMRQEFGRSINSTNTIYKFAADEDEAKRLDECHKIFRSVMGDYCPPMSNVLADSHDSLVMKACLDIGCGSGAWILEVAEKFPHVRCTAVDLVPLPAWIEIPSNLNFEIDDVSLGLEHFAGDFDVVHVRDISPGVRDYYKLIDDVALALRPNGLAAFIELDWRAYDIEKRPMLATPQEIWGSEGQPEGWLGTGMARSEGRPGAPFMTRLPRSQATEQVAPGPNPYYARFLTLVRQCIQKRGGHVDAAALLRRWVEEHHGYEGEVHRQYWVPVSEWVAREEYRHHPSLRDLSNEEIEVLRKIGGANRDMLSEFVKSTRPLLLATGVPENTTDDLLARTSQELRATHIPMYMRVYSVYARKRGRAREPLTRC